MYFSEYLYTLHVSLYVSICFEFDKVVFVVVEFVKFCLCVMWRRKKREKEEVMSSTTTSNVCMNWLKLNMKI